MPWRPRSMIWPRGSTSGALDRRDVEVQLDLVGNEDATGLQGRVPGEAPLGAQDLGLALEAHALVAERVLRGAVELQVDGERLGGAEDLQVTGDAVVVATEGLGGGGAEGHRGELLRLEEVRALE